MKGRDWQKEPGNDVETAFPKGVLPYTKVRGVDGVPADAYFIRVVTAFNRDLNPRAASKRRPCARPSTLLPRFGWRDRGSVSVYLPSVPLSTLVDCIACLCLFLRYSRVLCARGKEETER